MPGHTRSRTFLVLSVSLLLNVFCGTAEAQIRFDLPAQPLAQALTAIGSLANLNIYFDAPTVDGIQAPALKAELSADDALARLLAGTRLHAVRVDENTVRVVAEPESKHAQSVHDPASGSVSRPSSVHLASAGIGAEAAGDAVISGASGSDDRARSGALDEVIVSAQKREERLQDVPVPVTAISASTLLENNQVRIQDYYTSVPGLSATPGDEHGSPQLAIRGVTTGGFSNPTVGVVIDDVPYGASFGAVYGNEAPDIDPSDLARIEVLRGPQGTLYGASSIGGLLKFVTVDPSTDAFSGRVQAGTTSVYNGDGLGYNVRGAVNIPLSDTLAVRASGFTRRDPGYVDNVQTGQGSINLENAYGGRLSGLWRPSDELSLKVSALLQDSKVDGSPSVDVEPGLGDLQQSDLRNTGWRRNRIEAYSANLTAALGKAQLTFLSGYSINTDSDSYDFSDPNTGFGYFTEQYFGPSGAGAPLLESVRTKKFTQEIRLSMPITDRIDWLLGAFYNHENTSLIEQVLGANPLTGISVGNYGYFNVPTTFSEYAAFTDLTFRITDQFDVQLGGRESENRQSYAQTVTGPYDIDLLGLPSPVIYPDSHTKENAFTYLLTPRFKVSPDLMVYARLASGYRPGGPNIYATSSTLPSQYDPDKTENYEIGLKGDVLDHVLSFDASLYYIDWKDIQLQLRDPKTHITYYANGSSAKSEGVELSIESRPLRGLTVTAWVTYDDAVLTRDLPATSTAYGVAGDRLPNSSRFSGNMSLQDEFPITASVSGFVGGTLSYVGDRESVFVSGSPDRQVFPGYAQADLRAGVRYGPWTVDAFVTNVADRRGVLSGGIGSLNPVAFYYIQPRTTGLSVWRTF